MKKSARLSKVLHAGLGLALAGTLWAAWGVMQPPMAYADAYETGLKFYDQGDFPAAARYFLAATGQNDQNANAHYYLADTYLRLSKLAEAQAEYQKTLALAPDTQAARLSRVGLARLREYLNSNQSERWHQAGLVKAGAGVDQYVGDLGAGDDYLDEVTENGRLVRWSLLKMPLRLYIESGPQGIRNFQPAFANQIRRAMDIWVNALGHQLSYTLVNSREQADIRVVWVNGIDTQGRRGDGGTAYTAGLTLPALGNDQLQYMDVKMATFDIQGKPQTEDTIYAVAIHELGHSLGLLGHSEQASDIMYAENQRIVSLSRRDLNTIRRLYHQPADINNLPPESRQATPERETELAATLNAKMDEAVAKQEAIVKSSDMALNWLNLGVAYFQKGKSVAGQNRTDAAAWYNKALDATSQALQREPKDPNGYHKRSLVYQELGDYGHALQDIRQSIVLERKEAQYYMLESWYLANLGQPGEARNSLSTYLLLQPEAAQSAEVKQIQSRIQQQRQSAASNSTGTPH